MVEGRAGAPSGEPAPRRVAAVVSAPWSDRRVLVLGATGFIGRWVARALTARGADLDLGVRDPAIARPLMAAYSVQGRLHPVDLGDAAAVRGLVTRTRPAVVFNLAGYGVDPRERDEGTAYALNRDLVSHLCDALIGAADESCLVHAGSALEYGHARGDLSEDTAPAPDTLYGMSKLAGTRELTRRRAADGLVGLTARLFMVYGAGERPGRLLPTVLRARHHDERIALTEGLQRRDFTWVGDVAEGLVRLADAAREAPPVVNLATGRLHSVRHFVETAASVAGLAPGRLGFGDLPGRAEEMAHDPVNVQRLRTATGGWVPSTDPAAGIRATLEFHESAPDVGVSP